MKILLASQSPRRRQLLAALNMDFNIVSIDVEEVYPPGTPSAEVAASLSKLKATAYSGLKADELLITADTVVILDGEILGKPKDKREAVEMILRLSGKTHSVVTSVTFRTSGTLDTISDEAEVEFDAISRSEALWYVEHFSPLDKAGAYGIQEWVGMAKIRHIRGSYYTIMGLPTHLVYHQLKKMNVTF